MFGCTTVALNGIPDILDSLRDVCAMVRASYVPPLHTKAAFTGVTNVLQWPSS